MNTKTGDIVRKCVNGYSDIMPARLDDDLWVVDYVKDGNAIVTLKRESSHEFSWRNALKSWVRVKP